MYAYENSLTQVPYGRTIAAANHLQLLACVYYIYHICCDTQMCDMTALCLTGFVLSKC